MDFNTANNWKDFLVIEVFRFVRANYLPLLPSFTVLKVYIFDQLINSRLYFALVILVLVRFLCGLCQHSHTLAHAHLSTPTRPPTHTHIRMHALWERRGSGKEMERMGRPTSLHTFERPVFHCAHFFFHFCWLMLISREFNCLPHGCWCRADAVSCWLLSVACSVLPSFQRFLGPKCELLCLLVCGN